MTKQIAREQEHLLQLALHDNRFDAGSIAVQEWVQFILDRFNHKWPALDGDDLTKMQGAATVLRELQQLITMGPVIKAQPKE
jgi:hypothetical protein